jgi:transposase
MPGPATALELTAKEVRQLTACVRAGTTPQRLVRRARLILGSAAGLGSRALARQERMSRTTVRRWLGRFAIERCAGLQDRPRSGRPKTITPATRALVVALACERPAERTVPLRRYSLSELTVEVANRLPSQDIAPSRTAIWRWLAHDALRPWRFRSWIFPRDPHFLQRAGPVLDLDAGCIRPCPSDLTRRCASSTSTNALVSCSTWQLGMSIGLWSLAAANPRRERPLSADSSTT